MTGEVAGSATAAQFPHDVPGLYIRFKAHADNAGNVYIGRSGVTVADGSSDQTTGLQLAAGEDTGWIPMPFGGSQVFYYICDNAGDDFTYMVY